MFSPASVLKRNLLEKSGPIPGSCCQPALHRRISGAGFRQPRFRQHMFHPLHEYLPLAQCRSPGFSRFGGVVHLKAYRLRACRRLAFSS